MGSHRISNQEWQFYQQLHRAEISQFYYQQHRLELSANQALWDSPIDGKNPQQALNHKALQSICQDEALRHLAQQYEVAPLPTFRQLQKEMNAENTQRQTEKQQGEVLYGTLQYDLWTYYSTQKSACETAIVEKMIQQTAQNHEILQACYSSMNPKDFGLRPKATLFCYRIDAEEFQRDSLHAQQALQAIEHALQAESPLSAQAASELAQLPVFVEQKILDANAISKENLYTMGLLTLARQTGTGKSFFAPVHENSSVDALYFVSDLQNTDKPPFEASLAVVAAKAANQLFDQSITEIANRLSIRESWF